MFFLALSLIMAIEIFTYIDILGTAAFSVSGVFAAMQKRLDLFGIFIIAFITAIGGGTLRDVLIGDFPVNWMRTGNYSLVIIISASVALAFHRIINNFKITLLVFDSIGLGFFAVLGIQKGITFGLSPGICVALGAITACFGGLIRDIVLNQIPAIFQKEIYATACVLGGILFFILKNAGLANVWVDALSITFIVAVRLASLRFGWSLPNIYRKKVI